MDSFTIVDGIVAAVVVLSALLAFSRGFTREAMAIAGWVVAAYLATFFSPAAVPLVKEIPVVGDFLADSCELSIIVSFAVIFAVALVVVSLIHATFILSHEQQLCEPNLTKVWAFYLGLHGAFF